MKQYLGILIIAAMAGLIWVLSWLRKRRIQPLLDRFARIYCEAADHMLGEADHCGALNAERLEDGGLRVLGPEEQSEAIRTLFERGVDDEARALIRAMFETRGEIQAHLTGFNLIGKRINGVLNRVYDVANLAFSIIDDPGVVLSGEQAQDFDFFLNKQAYIRNVTLAAVASARCRAEIAR